MKIDLFDLYQLMPFFHLYSFTEIVCIIDNITDSCCLLCNYPLKLSARKPIQQVTGCFYVSLKDEKLLLFPACYDMKNRLVLDRLFPYHIIFIFLKIFKYSFMPNFYKSALCCFVFCAKSCSGIIVDFNTKAEQNTLQYKLDKSYILDDKFSL